MWEQTQTGDLANKSHIVWGTIGGTEHGSLMNLG